MNPIAKRSLQHKWQQLDIAHQMGNIGSEFSRVRHWLKEGDQNYAGSAFERMLELIDLTIEDRCWRARGLEIGRLREIVCEYVILKPDDKALGQSLENYFLQFGIMARSRG